MIHSINKNNNAIIQIKGPCEDQVVGKIFYNLANNEFESGKPNN